jgi:hypothetical protein
MLDDPPFKASIQESDPLIVGSSNEARFYGKYISNAVQGQKELVHIKFKSVQY